jgi:hypothetical protein
VTSSNFTIFIMIIHVLFSNETNGLIIHVLFSNETNGLIIHVLFSNETNGHYCSFGICVHGSPEHRVGPGLLEEKKEKRCLAQWFRSGRSTETPKKVPGSVPIKQVTPYAIAPKSAHIRLPYLHNFK